LLYTPVRELPANYWTLPLNETQDILLKNFLTASCAAWILCLPAVPATADEEISGSANKPGPLIQVFLGVLELDDQTGQWDEVSDDKVDVDFSSLPSGGIEAEYLFYNSWVHLGLNSGGSIAWKNEGTTFSGGVSSGNGGTLRIDVDNSLMLVEVHLGGYVRARLHERITTYAAAGPMVMYGKHEVEDENVEQLPEGTNQNGTVFLTESDSSDINIGYYARAGVDFEIAENKHMGFGVRYMSTELDFDKTVGKLDIEGPQFVLTYSAVF
jgi:opacity protein-like surface antigen